MHVDGGRLAEARAFEHRRPEQGVEVDDVLADEMVQLGAGVLVPEGVEVQFREARAEVLEAGHVADRRIEPDIEVLARLVGNLEAEIGRIAGDVPFVQAAVEPFGDLVRHRILQGAAAGPLLEHGLELGQLEEEVLGVTQYRCRAGDGRARVFQVGGLVGRAAFLAVVAVLVLGGAFRAGALDEAVGEEHALLGVEILGHRTGGDMPRIAQLAVDQLRQLAVFLGMGGVEVVEIHQEIGEVGTVFGLNVGDQLFRSDAFLLRAQHDRRAVGIVGADVDALVAAQLLEAYPHVRLDVLQHVAKVDRTVGVGQGAGNEDLTSFGHGNGCTGRTRSPQL